MVNGIAWRGVVTEDGKHFLADELRAFKLTLAQFAGESVIVTVRRVPKPQSPKKRGLYHAVFKVEFRKWLAERFRESYGDFTLDDAHELLVRLVLNLPEDVERASTALDAMNDEAYDDFLFRAEGFLSRIGVELPPAEPDPVKRYARTLRPVTREIAGATA